MRAMRTSTFRPPLACRSDCQTGWICGWNRLSFFMFRTATWRQAIRGWTNLDRGMGLATTWGGGASRGDVRRWNSYISTARSAIPSYLVEIGLRVAGQVGFLREVLSQ